MKWIYLFFGMLASSFLGAQSLQDITFGNENTLEVVTWNLENFPTKGNITIDSVATIVQAMDTDILALQEIWDEDSFDELMAKLPDFDGFYDPNYLGGLAYIFKDNTIEILEVYEIFHTFEYWNALPRAPFVIEFLFKGKKFYCINNHLKCCGDGSLQTNDEDDEENRRFMGMNFIKEYIDDILPEESVFIVGDLNDVLTDPEQNNVFQKFMNDSSNYRFADTPIALGSSSNWSYPSWPSHLDHILITNELFPAMENSNSSINTLKIPDYLSGGFSEYKNRISDHLPIGIKLDANIVSTTENIVLENTNIKIYPNPTFGMLYFDRSFDDEQYFIYDNVGNLIKQGILSGRSLDLTLQLSSGLYTILINDERENKNRMARFVIAQ